MKKLLLILLALLCLTACSKEQTPVETPEIETPVIEGPEEVIPDEPEQETVAHTPKTLEGLVEDAVGYVYTYPEVELPAVNDFYTELMGSLVDYAKQDVYKKAMERHTVADVTGDYRVTSGGKTFAVTYTVTVKYGDGETEHFDRMDIFDRESGKRLEA